MSAERTLMLGTDRKLDYLIISKRGESALGIKPLVTITKPHGVLLMVRMRATYAPSASPATKAKGLNFKELWPELQWENVDSHRVSTIIAVPIGLWPWQHKNMIKRGIDAFMAITELFANANLKIDHSIDDIAEFVFEGWGKEIAIFEEAFPEHPEKSPEQPVAYYGEDLYPTREKSVTAKEIKNSGIFTAIDGGKSGGPYSSPKSGSHLKLVGDLPDEEIEGEEDDGDDTDSD
jgi:hypothetical protein